MSINLMLIGHPPQKDQKLDESMMQHVKLTSTINTAYILSVFHCTGGI